MRITSSLTRLTRNRQDLTAAPRGTSVRLVSDDGTLHRRQLLDQSPVFL
jgi:hypothetical protein